MGIDLGGASQAPLASARGGPGRGPVVVDAPLALAAPCEAPAPAALSAALAEGVVLKWRDADELLPAAKLERAIVRRVEVRAAGVAVCDGRVIVEDPTFRALGRRGQPVELVAASALRPSFVVAVGPDDVAVSPPDGAWRVTRRDAFVAHGAWDLGAYRSSSSSAEGLSAGSR